MLVGAISKKDTMSEEQTITQKRVAKVVERMLASVRSDPNDAEIFSPMLEEMLTEMHSDDGFGTEGQCDPRGDFRDGTWFMERVEGIDTKVKQSKTGTTQQRVTLVLQRILATVLDNEDDAEMFSEGLEYALNELLGKDVFGSEGQRDPRGDHRDDQYSMTRVEGVD